MAVPYIPLGQVDMQGNSELELEGEKRKMVEHMGFKRSTISLALACPPTMTNHILSGLKHTRISCWAT